MNKITAIIVVKDNPKYLNESLLSIKDFVSETIIVNIGIKRTLINQLKTNNQYKIISPKESVSYVELIREEVKKYASSDWLLYLDPDEELSGQFKNKIRKVYQNYDYITIPRKNIVFGKWIKYSRWWPDYQTRMFKKKAVIWPKKIHTQPKLYGKGLRLDPDEKLAIIHHNYENIDEFISKLIRYTKAESSQLIATKQDYSIIKAGKQGISEFVSRFFAGQGYRDGMHGLVLAFLQIFYYLLVYFYYWEGKKYQNDQKNIKKVPVQFFSHGLSEVSHWSGQKKVSSSVEKIKYKIINKIINS